MKRILMMAAMLCLIFCCARAELLPDEVLDRCAKSYPDYAVLASDGYDDGTTGQWAIVLNKDGDNALVLAERTGGGVYALTVSNPTALPDAEDGYWGGMYTADVELSKQHAVLGRLSELTITVERTDGTKWIITSDLLDDGRTWGNVICEYITMYGDENVVWWSHLFAEDGTLNYMRHTETPEGKPLETVMYPRIPVRGEAASAHLLDCFDAGTYPYVPDLMNGDQLSDYAYDWVGETETLRQISVKPDQLILLTENAQGQRMLRIIPWINNQYHGTKLAGPLPKGASLDLYHAGDDELIVRWGEEDLDMICGFASLGAGAWQLKSVSGEENLLFTRNSVSAERLPMRNDGVTYGNHAWQQIDDVDFDTIPATLEEALCSLDQSGYAVVSNPNPADRLHLRELPRKDARSLGKFYNRTPVSVPAVEGEWANVSIGSITGWMMTKYLAFGDAMEAVKCAFPQEFIREEYDSLPLQPWLKGKTVAHIDRATEFYIVGVEEERYVILTGDGKTGYVKQSHFYPGNG